MKRLNFKVLFAVLVGSLCLVSCFKDDDEKNGFFYKEPEVEILSCIPDGVTACFFTCKVWPTKEMYDNHLNYHLCGMELSTDSLFRSSTKVVIGDFNREDFTIMGHVGDFFPDSTYYVRALLVSTIGLNWMGQVVTSDRYGNRHLNQSAHIIKEGKTVSVKMPHLDIDDYVHVSVSEMGPMNINMGIKCDVIDMTSAGMYDYNCSLELSENDTFSDKVSEILIKYNNLENKYEFKSLKPSCDYYYRVRLAHKKEPVVYYGDVIKISTPALREVNGMQYVDLGLSVMWANYNVGAHSPLEAGGFYCWGETKELTIEDKRVETIDFINTRINYSKYNETDGLLVLQPDDDVATVKWGAPWHMPDKSDIDELNENCTSKVLTIDGQKVVKFTSKINGNYIIFPIAGYYGGGKYFDWDQAYFWTRTFDSLFRSAFSVRSDVYGLLTRSTRSDCLNVRPVVKP